MSGDESLGLGVWWLLPQISPLTAYMSVIRGHVITTPAFQTNNFNYTCLRLSKIFRKRRLVLALLTKAHLRLEREYFLSRQNNSLRKIHKMNI